MMRLNSSFEPRVEPVPLNAANALRVPVAARECGAEWVTPAFVAGTAAAECAVVNFVALKMAHHAGRSGYHRLMDYVEGVPVAQSHSLTLAERMTTRLLNPLLQHSGSAWYHRRNLLAELAAARRWWRGSGQVFHFLYGENSFRYLGHLKHLRRRHAVISTYHTPVWRLRELITRPAHIGTLDAAVVVSTSQREFFAPLLGPERTFFIPHGIDTDYFTPVTRQQDGDGALRCILVGHHLRDFETLLESMPMMRKGSRPVQLVVVTHPDKHHHFAGLPDVELYSGLSDDALRRLYQSADLLLLPLLDSTANNALLEGMACGLPVVATDLPGVRDYLDDACGVLTPKQNATALAHAVMTLADQSDARIRMGRASRAMALRFAWPKVAEAFVTLYRNISMPG